MRGCTDFKSSKKSLDFSDFFRIFFWGVRGFFLSERPHGLCTLMESRSKRSENPSNAVHELIMKRTIQLPDLDARTLLFSDKISVRRFLPLFFAAVFSATASLDALVTWLRIDRLLPSTFPLVPTASSERRKEI